MDVGAGRGRTSQSKAWCNREQREGPVLAEAAAPVKSPAVVA